jgi:predicted HicB family RNase H-like nuclease
MMAGSAKKHPYNPLVEQFSETMVLRPGVLDFGRDSVDAISDWNETSVFAAAVYRWTLRRH